MYAGTDPVTGKDVYVSESTVDEHRVDEIKTRLLAKVDSQRGASTNASLGYVLERWLAIHEGEPTTLDTYRGYVDRTIKPALGDVPASRIRTRTLEEFYADLRRCGVRCAGGAFIEHRETEPHECRVVVHRRRPGRPARDWELNHDCVLHKCAVVECRPHVCKPMAKSTVRQIHSIIHGALDLAVRWDWIATNPAAVAKKPKAPAPEPDPPTPQQAARITAAAWDIDAAWGTFVWLAMVTGARRSELVALRWRDLLWEADAILFRKTKTHRMRRPALDPISMNLLAAHYRSYVARMAELGREPSDSAYVFSYEADHSRPCHPDGISHKYDRMCSRLGITTHLHALRHYSATELINAGVDIRSVAGRLGHGGGGATTLKVYAAWLAESDRRSADILANKLSRPSVD